MLKRTSKRGFDALEAYFGKRTGGARIGPPVAQDWVDAVKTLVSVGLIGDKREAADYYVTGLARPERYDSPGR